MHKGDEAQEREEPPEVVRDPPASSQQLSNEVDENPGEEDGGNEIQCTIESKKRSILLSGSNESNQVENHKTDAHRVGCEDQSDSRKNAQGEHGASTASLSATTILSPSCETAAS